MTKPRFKKLVMDIVTTVEIEDSEQYYEVQKMIVDLLKQSTLKTYRMSVGVNNKQTEIEF